MSKFKDLASAVRDTIMYCCYDKEQNRVDLRDSNLKKNQGYFYIVLVHYLKEYGFVHRKGFDETLSVRIAFDKLKEHAKKKNLRFLVEDLLLNPKLCGFFYNQLRGYGWVYNKK